MSTNEQPQTTKQKIDQVLGIPAGQTIDDFLDEIESDTSKLSAAFDDVSEQTREAFDQIDTKIQSMQADTAQLTMLDMKDLNLSLKEVEDLIKMSKHIFKHCYENVVASDLLDSELIGSVSKLLESIHLTIKEFVDLYKSKIDFVNKIKLSVLKLEQDKEKMRYKHELDMQKLNAMKKEPESVDAQGGSYSFSTEDLIKMMDQKDKQAAEEAQLLDEK